MAQEDKVKTFLGYLNSTAPLAAGIIIFYVTTVVSPIADNVSEIKSTFLSMNAKIATIEANSKSLSNRLTTIETSWMAGSPEIQVLRSQVTELRKDIGELRSLSYRISRNIKKLDKEE